MASPNTHRFLVGFLVSALPLSTSAICHLLSATVFASGGLLIILMFKITPRHSAEALPGVTQHKQAVRCLAEKMHTLDELYPGLS